MARGHAGFETLGGKVPGSGGGSRGIRAGVLGNAGLADGGSRVSGKARPYLIELVVAVVLLPLIGLLCLAVMAGHPPLRYGNTQTMIPSTGVPGQVVSIKRDLWVLRGSTLVSTSTFEKIRDDGRVEQLSGGGISLSAAPGKEQVIVLPRALTPGSWVMRVKVLWYDWPGFIHSMEAPSIKFTVVPLGLGGAP